MNVRAALRTTLVSAMIVGTGISGVVSATDDTTPEEHTDFTPDTIVFTPDTTAITPDTIAFTLDTIAVDGTIVILGFCDELVQFEEALLSEDPELIEEAGDDLIVSAPDDMTAAAVEDVLATIEAGPFDPAYVEAHTALIDQVRADCDYATVEVVATNDYVFEVTPADVAAGKTVFDFYNDSSETHQLYVGRIKDGVTEPIEYILGLPEEERSQYMDQVVNTSAPAGGDSRAGPKELMPGLHVAVCFLGDPEEPHWTLGMVHEFNVA